MFITYQSLWITKAIAFMKVKQIIRPAFDGKSGMLTVPVPSPKVVILRGVRAPNYFYTIM